jgi:hypothetical protein
MGDLNYRINGGRLGVSYLMRTRLHEVLHANDQLRIQQRQGRAFVVRSDMHVVHMSFPGLQGCGC